ncbi:unnamed protein product [Durusdinium trenchii]|uniref:Uncharacterized protein n=1 Tax=Durusdinium trenchii TaxID=1381693 RepID=A0ABP0KRN2_9DINO
MPAATGNPLPSLAELQMHGRHIKEAIDEQPTPIRLASYLGPGGTLALLITALVASSTAACLDHCLRVSDVLEDRLLECMDNCEVTRQASVTKTCESQCHSEVQYTRRQVQRQKTECRHPRGRSFQGSRC